MIQKGLEIENHMYCDYIDQLKVDFQERSDLHDLNDLEYNVEYNYQQTQMVLQGGYKN